MVCKHDYTKGLSSSGMYFISFCRKCCVQKPYIAETLPESLKGKMEKSLVDMMTYGQSAISVTTEGIENIEILKIINIPEDEGKMK